MLSVASLATAGLIVLAGAFFARSRLVAAWHWARNSFELAVLFGPQQCAERCLSHGEAKAAGYVSLRGVEGHKQAAVRQGCVDRPCRQAACRPVLRGMR